CLDQIRTRLRANPLAIQIPIGAEDGFEGVVDLIRMKAIYWDMETQGMKFEYRDIPASLRDEALKHRAKMIEVAAEANDTLMHKYLEGEQLSDQEIRAGLRERSIRNEIVLCMCGTAFKNKGVQALLDAVIEFMPSPIEMPDVKGINDDGEPATRCATSTRSSRSRKWSSPRRSSRWRWSRRPRPTRKRWAWRCSASPRKTPRSVCIPTRSPDRRSSPAWASCTWRSSSIA